LVGYFSLVISIFRPFFGTAKAWLGIVSSFLKLWRKTATADAPAGQAEEICLSPEHLKFLNHPIEARAFKLQITPPIEAEMPKEKAPTTERLLILPL